MIRRTNPTHKHFYVDFPNRKLIMTNDPSITGWGWAVVDPSDNSIVDVGAIRTAPQAKMNRIRKGDDRVRRVSEINRALLDVIKKHNIVMIVSELPHGSQSAVSAVMIGIVTGIMQTIGDTLNIPVEWFSEGDAKVSVSGQRSVPKDKMIKIICDLFKCRPWKKTKVENEAIADALAVYYVARQESPSVKMLAVTQ